VGQLLGLPAAPGHAPEPLAVGPALDSPARVDDPLAVTRDGELLDLHLPQEIPRAEGARLGHPLNLP